MTIDAWLMIAAVANFLLITGASLFVGTGTTWLAWFVNVITVTNILICIACLYRLVL